MLVSLAGCKSKADSPAAVSLTPTDTIAPEETETTSENNVEEPLAEEEVSKNSDSVEKILETEMESLVSSTDILAGDTSYWHIYKGTIGANDCNIALYYDDTQSLQAEIIFNGSDITYNLGTVTDLKKLVYISDEVSFGLVAEKADSNTSEYFLTGKYTTDGTKFIDITLTEGYEWSGYSLDPAISREKIEAFAREAKSNILDNDWQSLSTKLQYPMGLSKGESDSVIFNTAEEFAAYDIGSLLSEDFMDQIQKEDCYFMFSNYQGVCYGLGQLWIVEPSNTERPGELIIVTINN